MNWNLALTMLGCFALGLSVANFANAAANRLAHQYSPVRFNAWGVSLVVNGAALALRYAYGMLV